MSEKPRRGLVAVKERVTEGLHQAQDRFADARSGVVGRAQEAAGVARERLGSTAEGLRENYSRFSEDVSTYSEGFDGWVRERPARAVLLAAGIGFVFGLLMNRHGD